MSDLAAAAAAATDDDSPIAAPASTGLVPAWIAPAGILLVFFAAGVHRLFLPWQPANDWAVAELIVRHLDRHVPLSGPFSLQRGYNHPLPLVYLFEWPPYRLAGGRSAATLTATIWANGALLAAVTWMLARRRALGLGLLVTAGTVVFAATSDQGVLILPWNPNLAIVPALALLLVAWRVACGESRLLPVAAILAVWTAGAHLSFVPLAAVLVAFSTVSLVAGARRARTLGSLIRPAVTAGVIALVLLTPMLVDLAVNGSESNPVHIVTRANRSSEGTWVPTKQAVKVARAELAVPPSWASLRAPYDQLMDDKPTLLPVLVPMAALTAWVAWRRRATDELLGLAAALLGMVAGFVALLRLDDRFFRPWYLYPFDVASIGLFGFTVWSAGRSVRHALAERPVRLPSWPAAGRAGVARAGVAILALALAAVAVPSLHTLEIYDRSAREVAPLVRVAQRRYPPGSRILVGRPDPFDEFHAAALVLQLDQAGFDVRVGPSREYMYTSAMTAPPRWPGRVLVLGLDGPRASPVEGARLVGHVSITPNLFDKRDLSLWELLPRTITGDDRDQC